MKAAQQIHAVSKLDRFFNILQFLTLTRKKGKGVLGKGYWGLKLVSSERLYGYKHRPFNFAVVVTLKNLKGQNLNEEFKQLCIYNNWRVSDIDIDQMLQANLEGNTEINWTDDPDK